MEHPTKATIPDQDGEYSRVEGWTNVTHHIGYDRAALNVWVADGALHVAADAPAPPESGTAPTVHLTVNGQPVYPLVPPPYKYEETIVEPDTADGEPWISLQLAPEDDGGFFPSLGCTSHEARLLAQNLLAAADEADRVISEHESHR
ncbi:hypothetical protein SPF06_18565 [Sinomonas sp. JGH33]|uniref:Uncharacterized protein n=1 Tax=Sinomonas terricola TaxID=3110330 RepID=A0ABU5TBC4_9MICC|nr:hypothetical protein [Sinomonas sp. JGH33]MEA5456731.1 hypothetical protein [Sinomonas sp. JGH33]